MNQKYGNAPTTRNSTKPIDQAALSEAPKVLLHDHLDGGLRPSTVIELAKANGHQLPTYDADELAQWMIRGANRRDLPLYLETFEHTVAVMQTKDELYRVAAECAEDIAADNVVYAEVRYAPEQHCESGLSLDEVVEAVQEGFKDGCNGTNLRIGTLLTAMRHAARSSEIAELAIRHRDNGIVGFDIAGAEAGNPPTRHIAAFQLVQRANFHFTIHAGEAFGLPSIWEAIQYCGAERLGHGVRIVDDITFDEDGNAELGTLAAFVRDRRIPLELCPTSNVNTGAAPSIEEHPIGLLTDLSFRVTMNTDNRLISDTTMSQEFAKCIEAFGWGWPTVRWMTVNAMKSAFIPFDERLELIERSIKPWYRLNHNA